MTHLTIMPFLIPFATAATLVVAGGSEERQRIISFIGLIIGIIASISLTGFVDTHGTQVYLLGSWEAPYGIVLVADRMAAALCVLIFVLAIAVYLASLSGADTQGQFFHPLVHFQVAGIAGAFLTGDLFNLFVCFEILLIASYVLLLHGGGLTRTSSGIIYVTLNLVGSAVFLIAVAMLYGLLGTLNMADLAVVMGRMPPEDVGWVRIALSLLIGVFLLKAALLPMSFWLPRVYSSATVPVAMLFAILTKVGVISTLRLVSMVDDVPGMNDFLVPWLPILGFASLMVAAIGLFASRTLSEATGYFVLISSASLLIVASFAEERGMAALLYYLPHSTLATAGMFLLASMLAAHKGELGDKLVAGPPPQHRILLGLAYVTFAVAVVGLPPLAGFLGKLMLMQGGVPAAWMAPWWLFLLLASFAALLVLSRSGALLFWQAQEPLPSPKLAKGEVLALLYLMMVSPFMLYNANSIVGYAERAAYDLNHSEDYIRDVLPTNRPTERELRP